MVDYFELFDLPLSFDVDKSVLTKKYYELSKTYHPDKFTLENEQAQASALEQSTIVNRGYKTLKKESTRLRHILELLGAAPSEGNETMPQAFLMEMMDVNEAIMDYKMEGDAAMKIKAENDITAFETELEAELSEVKATFNFTDPDPAALAKIKDYFLKSKYLKRLKDNLQDRPAEM